MTTDARHEIPRRLDVDAAVPAFSKAMAHLDTTATRELDRVGDPGRPARPAPAARLASSTAAPTASTCTARTPPRTARRQQRIHAVAVWAESPFFTEKERAAFAFTESVTRLAETHVPHG